MLNLGYYDALKTIKKLDGYRYYLESQKEDFYFDKIKNIEIKQIEKIARLLKIKLPVGESIIKILFEKIIPTLVSKTKFKTAGSYKEIVCSLVEHIALEQKIDRFKIYTFYELVTLIKKNAEYQKGNKTEEAIYRFVKSL